MALKNYHMLNGLTLMIHKKNSPKFQRCWGKMKKISVQNVSKKIKQRSNKLEKGYSQDLAKQTVGYTGAAESV